MTIFADAVEPVAADSGIAAFEARLTRNCQFELSSGADAIDVPNYGRR